MSTPPTDAELDVLIRARLKSVGVDLSQLPAGTTVDPATGSPGQETVLRALRRFIRGSVKDISEFSMPAPGARTEDEADRLQQQASVPFMYPSIEHTWRTA